MERKREIERRGERKGEEREYRVGGSKGRKRQSALQRDGVGIPSANPSQYTFHTYFSHTFTFSFILPTHVYLLLLRSSEQPSGRDAIFHERTCD